MREETVLIIYQPPKVLLGMKKRKIGKGRYNGFGGGLEEIDKTAMDGAIRETQEEIGVTPLGVEEVGRIYFRFDSEEEDHFVHFFRSSSVEGELKETEEMAPEWFDEDKIPYENMWADDKYWLPLLLTGKKFEGQFWFNADHTIRDYKLEEVERLTMEK
jgi:8-oxo-dGTP diphosphatase / 2-hydroxy-dATP diphosphatase